MPLINRIEVSNFMNVTRRDPWQPTWPHAIFDLLGLNSVINMPNGRGKTTIVTAILCCLAGNGRRFSDIRSTHFAPKSTGYYSHVRVQITMDTESGAAFDMFTEAPQGQQMVFGVYGRSNEDESYNFYAYHGTFEECPVHRMSSEKKGSLELVSDKEFLDRLQIMPGRFPSSAREKSNEAWRAFVSKWFDMTSIEQQINYQFKAGGEGRSAYFEVKPRVGMKYSTAVFYEHLAPQLLTNVMGDYGEEDEHGIEDTIHEKARKVVHAKVFSETRRRQLIQTQRVLTEIQRLSKAADEIARTDAELQASRAAIAIELAVLRNIVIDKPLPGLPAQPPPELMELAQYLVICEGKPYLADKGIGYFSGEEPKVINQRAERKQINSSILEKSQVIEFTCDLDFARLERKHTGGQANKFFDFENTTRVLAFTDNFLPKWTRESAFAIVQAAFEWATANADTNPARIMKNAVDSERSLKATERDRLMDTITGLHNEKVALLEEQKHVREQQAEYQRMKVSGLFTSEELSVPAKTAGEVGEELTRAKDALTEHDQMVAKREAVYAEWQAFSAEYGESVTPETILNKLQEAESAARSMCEGLKKQRGEFGSIARALKAATSAAREKHEKLAARVAEADVTAPLAQRFDELFPGESPEGLDRRVIAERDAARQEKSGYENELASLTNMLKDISEFRRRFGEDCDPSEWLKQCGAIHEKALSRHFSLEEMLKEASISLDNLERFSIAPNKYVRDVTSRIGVPSIPLYKAVDEIELNADRKAIVLSLFSGLLNAPVLPNADQAVIAARNLADSGLEFPVFVSEDLSEFCRSGAVSFDGDLARGLFVGVRTQAVDCLLDPTLVEREKEIIRTEIARLEARIALLDKVRRRTSTESQSAKLAARASHAIDSGAIEEDADLRGHLEEVSIRLAALERRASPDGLEAIHGVQRFHKALGGLSLEGVRADLVAAEQALAAAETAEQSNDDAINKLNLELDDAAEQLRVTSVLRTSKEPELKRIIAFLADRDTGPAFMATAAERRVSLAERLDTANSRNDFRFELAEAFATSGLDRPTEIETRLNEITARLPELDKYKTEVMERIDVLGQKHEKLIPQVFKIDSLAHKLIKLYRKYRHYELSCETSIDRHATYVKVSFIRASTSDNELMSRLCNLGGDVEEFGEQIGNHSSNLVRAETANNSAKADFNKELERVVQDASLEMNGHLRHLLELSKSDPSRIKAILAATLSDYEKDKSANDTALEQLDLEWENMAGWLAEFTRRLPTYFKLMKKIFAPQHDPSSGKVTHAGFEIGGDVMQQTDDVEFVMGDIIRDIEEHENNHRKSSERDIRDFRKSIRNKFYQRVILNPSVKVCIPSISEKALMLEKEMASSGQGVAMTLLWIVKMADFVSERERQRKTVSGSRYDARAMASLKKIRTIDSQFVFIDGAFSHLSDRALIEDVLKGISRTHGRFQLIVTGHDPDYNFKHNFKYFPTLITGREIGDRYMYVENGKPVEPGEKGSYYGSMDLLRLHKIENNSSIGKAS